jgi:branched-subunit amino acid transport protein
MEIRTEFILILIGTALVTFLPRVLPLVFLSKVQLPVGIIRFLSHIPIAVFTALLAQEILTQDNVMLPLEHNKKFIALFPTLAVALVTRSLLGTVIAGVISMALIHFLIP